MSLRSIVLGCVAGTVLPGCFVEDPPPVVPMTTTTDGSDGTVSMSGPMTDGPMTTVGPTTDQPTTDEPTTVGPTTGMDDTTTDPTAVDSDTDGCMMACEGVVCGMAEGCEEPCGECGPMATCAVDQTYCGLPIGFYNDFGDSFPVYAELQFGFRFQIFEARVVRQLGVIAAGAGPQVRLALYDHDGTGPANRIVQTGAVDLYAVGHNEFNVGATPIEPGEYWVMIHTATMTPLARTFNNDNDYELALRSMVPFASGFPDTMDDEMIVPDYRYNLYMVVED